MSRLDVLLNYYKATRQKGHTTLMVDGIQFGQKSIMLFAGPAQVEIAFRAAVERWHIDKPDFANKEIYGLQFKTINWLRNTENMLKGIKPENWPAVVVDHYALEVLVLEDWEEKNK